MSRSETPSLVPRERESGAAVFDEPWQAQTLALADTLARNGAVLARAVVRSLGRELRAAEAAGRPDNPHTYYAAALAALESLLDETGSVSGDSLDERVATWRRAYLNTPHGDPVELAAGIGH